MSLILTTRTSTLLWHGLVGDGLAEVVVEVFAVCQPRVKIHSSQQGPQRGWRD